LTLIAAGGNASAAQLSIGDAPQVQEDTGPATFTVSLSKKAKRTVTADYATREGTASTDDFDSTSGTLKIKRHKEQTMLDIGIKDDTDPEPGAAETFTVRLTHPHRAALGDSKGVGKITDDECAGGADTDADGIPDCVDECPQTANPSGPCPHTIYEVKDGTLADQTQLTVSNAMVTAVSGTTAWLGVQPSDTDFDGYDYSGVEVDVGGIDPAPALAVGDRVRVEGTVDGGTIDATEVATLSTGGTPAARSVSLDDFGAAADDDVLVTIHNFYADGPDADGNWPVSSSGFLISDRIIGSLPLQEPAAGYAWRAGPNILLATGIVETGTDTEIWPRTAADLVPGLYSFAGNSCLVNNGTPQAIRAVFLSAAAPVDTAITILSSDPSVATVPATVTVPQGQTSVGVFVTPLQLGTSNISASLGDTNLSAAIQVKNSCP
jgi:hypothetical protein